MARLLSQFIEELTSLEHSFNCDLVSFANGNMHINLKDVCPCCAFRGNYKSLKITAEILQKISGKNAKVYIYAQRKEIKPATKVRKWDCDFLVEIEDVEWVFEE